MSCTTCNHGQFERTPKGNIKRSVPGRCTFKLGALVVPVVMTVQARSTAIWPDMGADCPTFTPATSASAGPRGTEERLHTMLADLRQDFELRAAPILNELTRIASMSPTPTMLVSIEQARAAGLTIDCGECHGGRINGFECLSCDGKGKVSL